jgi:hypothetical protein
LPPSLKELKLFGPCYMGDLVRGTINAQCYRYDERQNLHSVNLFFCWRAQALNLEPQLDAIVFSV